MKIKAILLIAFLGIQMLYAQVPFKIDNPDDFLPATEPEKVHETVFVHDTLHDSVYISSLEEVTNQFGLSFDEYVRQFLQFADEKDSLGNLSSEIIYMNYFLPLVTPGKGMVNKKLVTREYVIQAAGTGIRLNPYDIQLPDSVKKSLTADCLLSLYGSDNTDRFLKSPTLIKSCMGQVFSEVVISRGNIKGINLYFPDFSYKEKKAMAQFIKSVSLVVDSSRVNGIRGISLYASFSKPKNKSEEKFLCGLTQMVDSIMIFQYQTEKNTLPEISIISSVDAKKLSLFSKLRNQFYLARNYKDEFPETGSVFNIAEIYSLMDADYPDNSWEMYVTILIGIGICIVLIIALYLILPMVSYYINKNMDYVYSLVVMVFLEVLLLIASMFESMSKDDVFTMGNENRYIILLLPLLFIFIVPMMKAVGKRKQLP